MEKSKFTLPYIYVVGSGASGLLFNSDLKDSSTFSRISKIDIFEKPIAKIYLSSNLGLAQDENLEIYQWGEIDYDKFKKVSYCSNLKLHKYLKKTI